MSEVKTRSIRLDDENWQWLANLPGRTSNDAVTALRASAEQKGDTVTGSPEELSELVELVRSLPDSTDMRQLMQEVFSELRFEKVAAHADAEITDNRPKNAYCKHCGSRFVGAKFATICPECKSSGHTLTPADCPVCGEGRAI